MKKTKRNVYLDYAGATPIDKSVSASMAICKDLFTNPSAIYESGLSVKRIMEESREKIAKILNAHSDEIIFTGSGTESNALAILGTVRAWRAKNNNKIPHIITSQIEHRAVLMNCRLLEDSKEAIVSYIHVDSDGLVDLKELEKSIKENTILISIMYANNEIGVIEPIEEIAKIIRKLRKENNSPFPIFHTDACQAINYLYTENIDKLGVDLMTFNSSKIYGPKGIGILYKKRSINLHPLYSGGGQEFGLRSGTEDVSAIVGVSKALEITNKIKEKESNRLIKIRDYAIEKLLNLKNIFKFNVVLNGHKNNRLPNNINISISGISSELLVIELSVRGIFISEKSACQSDDGNTSYVIRAIRKGEENNQNNKYGSLRITLGRNTKKRDIDKLVKSLSDVLTKYEGWK